MTRRFLLLFSALLLALLLGGSVSLPPLGLWQCTDAAHFATAPLAGAMPCRFLPTLSFRRLIHAFASLLVSTSPASVAMTSMDMGTSHPVYTDLGNGHYSANISFSMPGLWRVTIIATPPNSDISVTHTEL